MLFRGKSAALILMPILLFSQWLCQVGYTSCHSNKLIDRDLEASCEPLVLLAWVQILMVLGGERTVTNLTPSSVSMLCWCLSQVVGLQAVGEENQTLLISHEPVSLLARLDAIIA